MAYTPGPNPDPDMDFVEYRGHILQPATLNTLVASAASGRPLDAKSNVTQEDPAEWLAGLVVATRGTPLAADVDRSMDMVLRTGDSKQLGHMAALALHHDVFAPANLINTLGTARVHRVRGIAEQMGLAVSAGIARGHIPYDPELRGYASDRRFRGSMTGAYVHGDRAWFIDNALTVLGDKPQRAATRLSVAVETLDEAQRVALYEELQAGVSTSPGWHDAIRELLAPQLEEAGGPSMDAMPWRGEDGAHYQIPGDTELLRGGYAIRRGGQRQLVDPTVVAPFRISDERARALTARQVDALYGRLRDTITSRFSRVKMPESLSDITGASTESLLSGTPPKEGRSADEVVGELAETITSTLKSENFASRLRTLAEAVRDGVEAAKANLAEEAQDPQSTSNAPPDV